MGDTYVDRLKREKEKREENQKNIMSLEVDNRRLQLSDLLNKEAKNIKVKIPYCQDLFVKVVHMNNVTENFTKSKYKKYMYTYLLDTIFIFLFVVNVELMTFLQTMMINNHGKTMEKLIQEEEEMSASNVMYYFNYYLIVSNEK